jgi:very-short-patch-repair endonuclease
MIMTNSVEDKDSITTVGNDKTAKIKVSLASQINFACHQNSVSLIRDISIKNDTEYTLSNLTLRMESSPEFVTTKIWNISDLPAGGEINITDRDTSLNGKFLLDLTESMSGDVSFVLYEDDIELARISQKLDILARNEWGGYGAQPELLAAFSMPNDPAIDKVLSQALDILRRGRKGDALDGYASGKRTRAWEVSSAIWSAVASLKLKYSYPPKSFESTGQKIRVPSMVISGGLATCMDTTMLFCSALEQAGLNPIVVIKKGHAFVGLWLQPESFRSVVLDDVVTLRKRIAMNEVIVFETTLITQDPVLTFTSSIENAKKQLDEEVENDFICVIDIKRARDQKIKPLSFIENITKDETVNEEGSSVLTLQALDEAPVLEDFSNLETLGEIVEHKETRLERWQRKLLDLSLRNPLLNSRPSQTSIPIICADPGLLEDKLADGKKINLLPLPNMTSDEGRDASIYSSRTGEDLEAAFITSALDRHEVYVKDEKQKLEARLISLYRKAKGDLEEGGANTLFLSFGFLTWQREDKKDRKFRAPLILIPVELKRKSVRSGVKLVLHDDEPRFNTTLLEMLRQDMGLDIQGLDGELPTDESGVDVAAIWNKIRHEVKDIEGFEVTEDVVLSTFSFAKYLMWKDLVDRTDKLKENPVVRHLMETPRDPYSTNLKFPDPNDIDKLYKPAELFTPLPADSSQISSVIAAGQGKDFVIIGPPGSGKSQTISNMIAHLMGCGKTVLFVSEKAAALNVVYRRLKEVGLGDFCLELHSNKAKKLDVINQFRNAWDVAEKMTENEWTTEAGRLEGLRDDLNDYVKSLHAIHKNGLTVHQAIGLVAKNKDISEVTLSFPKVDMHSKADLEKLRELTHELRLSAEKLGNVTEHPLKAIAQVDWSNAWQHKIIAISEKLSIDAKQLQDSMKDISGHLHIDSDDFNITQIRALSELANALSAAYGREIVFALNQGGREAITDGESASALLLKYRSTLKKLSIEYSDLPWKAICVDELTLQWQEAKDAWWPKSLLKGAQVRKALVGQAGAKDKPEPEQDLKVLADLKKYGLQIEALKEKLSNISEWNGFDTNIEALNLTLTIAKRVRSSLFAITDDTDAAIALKAQVKKLVDEGNELLGDEGAIGRSLKLVTGFQEAYENSLGDFSKKALQSIDEIVHPQSNSLKDVRSICNDIIQNKNRLNEWCSWRHVRNRAFDAGLKPLIDSLENGLLEISRLEDGFDASYCRWWVERKWDLDDTLRKFNSKIHQDKIEQFKQQDDKIRELTSKFVRARICGEIPQKDGVKSGSEYGTLRRILEQKRPRKSLRRLITDMPNALTQLTPCVLMSPLSISQYLPADQKTFDVVIFDEASQITVWDAIGSIARAGQTIVAGDPKQLPPTSFFGRADDGEDDDLDEGDLESILDEMLGAGIPTRHLKWHYRSENESLITFSNHNYYGGNLITFPSPTIEDKAVKLVKVNGTYQKGGGRTNREEADAVVAEIMKRLKDVSFNESKRTIGVVTFNTEQQRLIENLLDEERRKHPDIEPHFGEDVIEPVFVKNLESVQGDERDVILFSTTYGPDASGKLSMNFGPLNRDGGERRLNVAITRARAEMIVFSSLSADTIDLSRTSATGVRDLKHFLDFADRGVKALGEAIFGTQGDFDSPFEVSVARGLQERGWTIHPQIGVSAFRVDLGVVHPDFPGRYLVGVECDGATYHRSATARDRDKVREEVLSRLGWKLLRLWSTDFWVDAEGELDKLDQEMKILLENDRANRPEEKVVVVDAVVEPQGEDVILEERFESASISDSTGTGADIAKQEPLVVNQVKTQDGKYSIYCYKEKDYSLIPDKFYDADYAGTLEHLIKDIVSIEAPIRLDVLSRRVARAHDFKKAGRRIVETVERLVKNKFQIMPEDGHSFVWPADVVPSEWNHARSPVDDESVRPVDEISHIELLAFARAHKASSDPVESIKHALGFSRLMAPAKERIIRAVNSSQEQESTLSSHE